MTLAEDLKAARDIVAKGWRKGGLTDGRGNVCAVGAVNLAVGNKIYFTTSEIEAIHGRREAAIQALDKHISDEYRSCVWDSKVPSYNDASTTTHQDILNLFDKALADLGAL